MMRHLGNPRELVMSAIITVILDLGLIMWHMIGIESHILYRWIIDLALWQYFYLLDVLTYNTPALHFMSMLPCN